MVQYYKKMRPDPDGIETNQIERLFNCKVESKICTVVKHLFTVKYYSTGTA